jgi:hypothetical protein
MLSLGVQSVRWRMVAPVQYDNAAEDGWHERGSRRCVSVRWRMAAPEHYG